MTLNPEADEVSEEDLAAASDMLSRLAAGTFYSDHETAVRLAQQAFDIDEDRFGPQD
jgi:hypothetical protein